MMMIPKNDVVKCPTCGTIYPDQVGRCPKCDTLKPIR